MRLKSKKQKKNVLFSDEYVNRIQRCKSSLFSSYLMQPREQFLCRRDGSSDETLSICTAQENLEMTPKIQSGKLSKSETPGSFR
jgi:hypothetical protein